jgi:serine/threonine-protein kinase
MSERAPAMATEIAPEIPAGTRFGPHEIVRPIAEGGMAVVYEARHVELEKRVALKVMRRAYAAVPELVERFLLEARMASRLHHPHVIGVSDVGVSDGHPFMAIDFLEGEDLATLLDRAGRLPLAQVADLLLPIVSAVAAAHGEGIVHRDLKPENVFLASGRRRVHPILLDFGIAKVATSMRSSAEGSARKLTQLGTVLGTPQYMAPEQARADASLDARSDQYALGIVMFRCLTGEHPYPAEMALDGVAALTAALARGDAPPASSIATDLPASIDALLARCLRASPDERFESVRDVGRSLWPHASPMVQAIWAEEFGDAEEIMARLSLRVPRPAVLTGPPPAPPPPPPSPAELRALPVFAGCSDDDLASLARTARTRRFEAGARIIERGAHAHSCFLLLSGQVQFVRETSDRPWKASSLEAPSVFGHVALVANVPRKASVDATTECLVVEITREVFERRLAPTSEVVMRLREHAAVSGIRRLRQATQYFASLIGERARGEIDVNGSRDELAYVRIAAQDWSVPLAEKK